MTIIDIILIACFIPGIILGIQKGFISQLFGFISLIVGVFLAFSFSNITVEYLKNYIHLNFGFLYVISFLVILIISIYLIKLIGKIIEKIFKLILLGWLNRILGGFFGFLTTLIIMGLIIVCINYSNAHFNIFDPAELNNSKIYCSISDFTHKLFPYLNDLISK